MGADRPERPPLKPVLAELRVKRNATIGIGVGLVVAILAYGYRVVIVDPAAGAITSPLLFGLLAFVLAITFGMLVAIALTVGTVIARIRTGE